MGEILIYGDIGFEVLAKDVVQQLSESDGPVTVRIDSYGGDAYAGISIMNALRRSPEHVTVHVDGMAASAASFIAVGGADTLVMSPNSSLLIHGAWTQAAGNSEDLAELSANLNQISDNIASIYAEKSGTEPAYWRELMKKDTTFTAEQAVDVGLADRVGESPKSVQAEQRHAVMASRRSRFEGDTVGYGVPVIESRRSESPPTENIRPVSGQEGETMEFLNRLAQMTGKSEDAVLEGIASFIRNEQVQVTAPMEVTYPDTAEVVPTGKVEVAPAEPLPAGVVPNVEIGEGFTAEAAEDGTVTVRASDAVSVDDTADLVVTFGDDTAVTVSVKVVPADAGDDEDTTTVGEPAPGAPAPEAPAENAELPAGYALVPQAHLDDLTARAQLGDEAFKAKASSERSAEVDKWIQEGRFAASRRASVLAEMNENEDLARRTWGQLPVNSIPRAEVGYGVDRTDPEETTHKTPKAGGANPFPSVRF